MKIKGFTLIEILVVIVIISILLAVSLGISGGRVQILKEKYAQEQFVSTYNTLFSRNFLTNYYSGVTYENLIINMRKGNQGFSYSYNGNDYSYTGKTYIEGKVIVSNLSGGNESNLSYVDIIFKPYEFGCVLSGDTILDKLDITLYIDNKKDYCYSINHNLCRLEKIDCIDSDEQN